jgi:hypothetical protein
LRGDIIVAVKTFFATGHMPEGTNDTSIVLIPKIDNPMSLSDYRPIGLCNVVYKIVSKCLVNRLRPILGGVISENQSAFIPGRMITDNALLAFECLHYMEHGTSINSNFCAYKLDLSKAYDRVDWSFLESTLLKIGFCHRWVKWIMACVTTKEVNDGALSPIKVCRNAPGISHLMFADDTMLFFRANEEQAVRVKEVLDVYEKGTGQLINPAKCSILFSPICSQDDQVSVRSSLNVVQQAFEDKYLGLPTPEGRMNKGKFQSLQARLSKWLIDLGDSLLAQSAREVLIKAIAQAIPTYVMGVFKLLASVCDDLEQLIRNYWWGSEKGKRKIHWIGWPRLLRPKSQGGMGFKDMRLFNQSLLARQAWRLINFPNSLCARVLRARYHPNGDLIDTVFTGNPSSTWTAIVYGLELLKKGVVWRVGNGRSIRIWRDSWLPRRSYMKVLSPRRSSRLRWVSELLDTSGQWRTELVRRTFNPIDAEVILSIKPAFRFDDVLAWQPTRED